MFGHRYFGARHFGPRYWGTGASSPIPPVAVPHLTWGSFSRLSDRFRGRIPKRICEIIEEVAEQEQPLPQIAQDGGKAESYYKRIAAQQIRRKELKLREELKEHGIAWRKIYLEALMEAMRREDDEMAILCILACS
jgi:siroheme synthase (precorrin-2 oxidase/ferrochelatase)